VKMRLINTTTLELVEFQGQVPNYAILSHTWGEEEACLQDWENTQRKGVLATAYSTLLPGNSLLPRPIIQEDPPEGYWKILEACVRACADGFDWIWADTTNIDKTSSSELSEAINSMYAWYRNADVCYAYLADVPAGVTDEDCWKLNSAFRASRWFKRGWTLQELLGPKEVVFFSEDWGEIGRKATMSNLVSHITGIDSKCLLQRERIASASIAERMSWAADRATTRTEDISYCLLGLFDVNMPLIYGEGAKAFIRLQEEIMKVSEDHSIFAWTWIPELSSPVMVGNRQHRANRHNKALAATARQVVEASELASIRKPNFPITRLNSLIENTLWKDPLRVTMLAPDPINFFDSGKFGVLRPGCLKSVPSTFTNAGLSIQLPMLGHIGGQLFFAVLHRLRHSWDEFVGLHYETLVCIPLVRQHSSPNGGRWTRAWFPNSPIVVQRGEYPGKLFGEAAKELQVCRDIQRIPFHYDSFGGTTHQHGFWVSPNGTEESLHNIFAGGYTTPNAVFNEYGIFFDTPEKVDDEYSAAGGLLVLSRRSVQTDGVFFVIFLAMTFGQTNVSHYCEVVAVHRNVLQTTLSNLDGLYRTLSEKNFGSPSRGFSSSGKTYHGPTYKHPHVSYHGCTVRITNECALSHAADSRIWMTQIIFE
jgi:hypothetical protein